MRRVRRLGIVGILVCLLLGAGRGTGRAQADDVSWSEPVNLSRSGAAETPVLIASPPNKMQAFWWDRFDGLMTSYTTGNGRWSAPKEAPVQIVRIEGEGAAARVVTSTLTAMPQLTGTGDEVLALWLGRPDPETEARPLLASRLRVGSADWSLPETIAASAIDWDVTVDPQGDVHLIYRQPQALEEAMAGIYYRHFTGDGAGWSVPAVLHSSAYVRLWTDATIHLAVVADGLGNVLAGWDDPRQGAGFYTRSANNGESWGEPVEVGSDDLLGQHVRFVFPATQSRNKARSEVLMFWEQVGAVSTCALMQQYSGDGGKSWSGASQVLRDLTACPVHFAASHTADGQLLAILDEGTDHLLLAVWNGEQWSRAKSLSLSFENAETGANNYLAALQAQVVPDNTLVVAGLGQDAEVWTLQGQIDFGAWAFAPPSPWSPMTVVAESEVVFGFPAVATDAEGHVHALWSAATGPDQPDTALYYSFWDGVSWSRPAVVLDAGDGVAKEPAIVFADAVLHAVWSSGPTGTVLYSKAYPRDAYAAGGWSEPSTLGELDGGSAPAITRDLWGRLHVIYAVPLNEGRGIYYTRSDDNGESWSNAVQVFDAVAERWPGVDHPELTVDERGVIHAVWVRTPLPGHGVPQGVYYARSTDRGKTWSPAMILASSGYDWPHIRSTATGTVVVTWQDAANDAAQYRVSTDSGRTWGYVSRVSGQMLAGRAALVSDNAGSLHFTALTSENKTHVALLHLVFTGGQWTLMDPVELPGVVLPAGGAVPTVAGELGVLDVIGTGSRFADGTLLANLWHLRRRIESRPALLPDFTPEPTSTPTPAPTPVPSPTPRPAVDPHAPRAAAPVIELGPVSLPILALGGIGMTFLIVVAVVTWKLTHR